MDEFFFFYWGVLDEVLMVVFMLLLVVDLFFFMELLDMVFESFGDVVVIGIMIRLLNWEYEVK